MPTTEEPAHTGSPGGQPQRTLGLTVAEFSAAIGRNIDVLYGDLADGNVPGAYRIGRHWRIDLDTFRAAHGLIPAATNNSAPPTEATAEGAEENR